MEIYEEEFERYLGISLKQLLDADMLSLMDTSVLVQTGLVIVVATRVVLASGKRHGIYLTDRRYYRAQEHIGDIYKGGRVSARKWPPRITTPV